MLAPLLTPLLFSLALASPPVSTPRGLLDNPFGATNKPWDDSHLKTVAIGALSGGSRPSKSYEYVIVGGGTAGNTLAYRLAAANHTVALIEAGYWYEVGKPIVGPAPLGDIIGIGSNPLDSFPGVDHQIITTPQEGADNRKVHYAQGKCLGGSSALNFMIHHRPNRGALDAWADIVGDDSYRFDSFLPHYKQSVSFTPPNTKARGKKASEKTIYREDAFLSGAQGGPVQVTYPNWTPEWSSVVIKGLEAVGINTTDEYDLGKLNGYHYAQTTIDPKEMTRSTSANYVHKAKREGLGKRLHVFLGSRAQKVIFDANKVATGVEVAPPIGFPYTIKVTKEVIVSAGAFHSPQLLMLSGIGASAQLSKAGIPVIADRRGVGLNLTDHVLFGPTYELKAVETLSTYFADPLLLAKAVLDYALAKTGPLTSNMADLIAWEKLPTSVRGSFTNETIESLRNLPADWPEVEILPAGGFIGDLSFPILQQPLNGKIYSAIIGALAAPFSRGEVTLASSNPRDKPLVNPRWLTDKRDQEIAVAIYRRIRQIYNTDAVKSVRASTLR